MKTDAWAFIILLAVALTSFFAGRTYEKIQVMKRPAIIQYVTAPETDAEFKRLQKQHGQDGTIILKQEWTYWKAGKRHILK